MSVYQDQFKERLPSLVHLCQRVAANHADLISNLGGELRYDLVQPILQRCSIEQLVRLEEASPHLQSDTPEIWKELCFQKYRLIAEEHYTLDDEPDEPDSWKSRFFSLQQAEARRFEQIGSKIRSQRLEADERKREREVRFTDRVPPPKRPRTTGWGAPAQPKTLFQKTRSEASKLQKSFYSTRLLPPMHTGKTMRVLSKPDYPILPPLPKSTPSRVTVNTVTIQRRTAAASSSSSSASSFASTSSNSPSPSSSSNSSPPSSCPPPTVPLGPSKAESRFTFGHPKPISTSPNKQITKVLPNSIASTTTAVTASPTRAPSSNSVPLPVRPLKSPAPTKKDPMASLFVPKHRAYSQRPVKS